MKHIVVLSLLLSGTLSLMAQNCKVVVTAENYPIHHIFLVWSENGEMVRKEIVLTDGKGEAEVTARPFTQISLINQDKSKHISFGKGIIPVKPVDFFAEKDQTIHITFDHLKWPVAEISGGKVNHDFMRLSGKTAPLEERQFAKLRESIACEQAGNKEKSELLKMERDSLRKVMDEEKEKFIAECPDSYVSLILLSGRFNNYSLSEYEIRFLRLDQSLREMELGKKIATTIAEAKKTQPGDPAPDFAKKDKEGKAIHLSDYKGRYLLIDFWGTWCAPCRQSHPHLVGLYEKYAPMGLAFINVASESGQKAREEWLKVIDEDRLTWTQILNNEGQEECDMVRSFSVKAFPTKILIDPQGKIVERYVGGGQGIDTKLKEIFGK